jgi:hypothetical protein
VAAGCRAGGSGRARFRDWADLLPGGVAGGDTVDLADILDAGIDDGGSLL